MRLKDYLATVMFIFLIIGVAHFVRALTKTAVMFGDTAIPLWISWVAVVVALYLCYQAYQLRK